MISWLKSDADPKYHVTLVGGVPTHWRLMTGDAKPDPEWAEIYTSFDIISPWSVGRYGDGAGADSFKKSQIEPDLAALRDSEVGYMPVVFPGFRGVISREDLSTRLRAIVGGFFGAKFTTLSLLGQG